MSDYVMTWIGAGLVLVFLEVILPGGIIVFLGVSAIMVGIGIHFEWINTIPMAITSWFALSIINLFAMRSFFMKFFEGDTSIQNTNEDLDDLGRIVVVAQDIYPHKEGRIRFKDSTWIAQSEHEIKKDAKAIITNRKGNKYVVSIIEE